jgi:hypothetical protein
MKFKNKRSSGMVYRPIASIASMRLQGAVSQMAVIFTCNTNCSLIRGKTQIAALIAQMIMTDADHLHHTVRDECGVTHALRLFSEREKTAKRPSRLAGCMWCCDGPVAHWCVPNCVASLVPFLYPSPDSEGNYNLSLVLVHCETTLFQLPEPNVVVEWLTLLLRIRKVPASNLGPETGYPDWGFRGFP